MGNISWHLHQSILYNTPITITVKSQYSGLKEYHCVVFEWLESEDKIRFHLMDENYRLLYDDMYLPQIATQPLKQIKSIQMIYPLYYSYPDELSLKSKVALEKQTTKDFFDAYQFNIRKLFAINTFELIKENIETIKIDPLKTLYKSVILLDKPIFQPLLSVKVVYNIEKACYEEKELVINKTNHYALKIIPNDVDSLSISTFKKFIKPSVITKEESIYFLSQTKVRRSIEDRIKLVLNVPQTRPFKAYFDLLNLKNLGRKDYILPFTNEKLYLRENQIAFSSMKHPVTMLYDANIEEITQTAIQIVKTALLNNQSILIIDKYDVIKSSSLPSGVLDLKDENNTLTAFNKSYTSLSDYPLFKAHDYESYFDHIESTFTQVKRYEMLVDYIKHFNDYELFHESIMAESLMIDVARHHYETPISELYNKTTTTESLNDTLEHLQSHRMKKLNHKAYRKLSDLVLKQDIKEIFKEIKKPYIFQQIKQIFPAIIVKNTKFLAYQKKPFDCMIFINPNHKNSLDLHYSDKVTILSDAAHKEVGLTSVYLNVKEDVVKTYQGSNSYASLYIHPVQSKKESYPHESTKEVLAIKQFISNHPYPYFDIRTAFNAQKKLLKTTLKKPVQTLYDPLKNEPVIIGLGLHKNTQQETYDWIKNHPHMMPKLYDNHPQPIHLFIDLDTVLTLSDSSDLLFRRLFNLYPNNLPVIDLNTFDHYLYHNNIKTYKKNENLKSILLGLPHMESIDEAAFTLYNHTNDLRMILLRTPVHPSIYTIERLLKRSRQEKIDVYFIDTTMYQSVTFKVELLKQLRRLEEIG
ncbi:hypothetical protein [Liberiplasma polymorphum]|uniref:hypothetical protein n=1 Tax=Liberiplasma polymorphum TaxID=3374570 RepID=UPI0037725135